MPVELENLVNSNATKLTEAVNALRSGKSLEAALQGLKSIAASITPRARSAPGCQVDVLATCTGEWGNVVVEAGHVYFTTSLGIERVAKDGTQREVCVPCVKGLRELEVHGNEIFWTTRGGTVARWRMGSGGAPEVISAMDLGLTSFKPEGLAADDHSLYFGDGGSKGIYRLNRKDGRVARIATVPHRIYGLAIDGSEVFAYDMYSMAVTAVSAQGALRTVIAPSERVFNGGAGFAMDATLVYVARSEVFLCGPKTGGEVTVLKGSPVSPGGLAVDANHLYWLDLAGSGIARMPRTSGERELLAWNQGNFSGGFTQDEESLYWLCWGTANDTAELKRMRKT